MKQLEMVNKLRNSIEDINKHGGCEKTKLFYYIEYLHYLREKDSPAVMAGHIREKDYEVTIAR